MFKTSSTPMPATGSLQLVEAVIERFDGAPVGERRRWWDEFKAQAVAAALEPGVNVSALARRLGISPPQLFGWRKAFLKKQDADITAGNHDAKPRGLLAAYVSSYPDLLVLGDQQTSDRSFRHCPIFGG